MEVSFQILIIIFMTTVLQSIFGIGLLLFGTPLLLLSEIDFSRVLSILLPCSVLVSLIQVYKDFKFINWTIVKKVLFISLPFIVVCLLLMLQYEKTIKLNKIIGLLLLILSFCSIFKINIFKIIEKYAHQSLYFIFLGIIHGTSNLGGSLLSAYVKDSCQNKKSIRSTIAMNYLFFAIIQIIVLISKNRFTVRDYDYHNWIIVLITSLTIGNFIFIKFSDIFYTKLLNGLIGLIGIYFLLK